jgi:hypothetical protein
VIAWGTAGTMILLASAMVYTSIAGG